ncbi:HTH domain-containing protein [Mesorhizobium caraganae]|uniref:HTH domain-containing protein n=1 Tax=Mesorhizobium caraganae TaxID=483206 RepID=UPI001780151C|nr:HTH domain-containing protein [Mesorhizobium caraganae]
MATEIELERHFSRKELIYEVLHRGPYPIPDLADELGVLEDTAEARIQELRKIGVPIFSGELDGELNYVIPIGPDSLREFLLAQLD